jgi:hypothetical protein
MDIFKKKRFEGKVYDGEKEMETLFNGYGEIGGESAPYSKAVNFLSDKTPGQIVKILDACLVVYSKPLSYLFEGKAQNPGGKKKGRRSKQAVTREGGVEEEKTDVYTATGARVVDDGLAKYLPIMTKIELESMDPESKADMDDRRLNWPDAFQALNVTKCKRLAMLGLELRRELTKRQAQWLNLYGDRPSRIKDVSISDKETKEIFMKDMAEFIKHKDDWSQPFVSNLINGKGNNVRVKTS